MVFFPFSFVLFSAHPWDGCHVVIIPVDEQFVKSATIWRHIVNSFVLWVKMCSTVSLWRCHVPTEGPMGQTVLHPVHTWTHRRFYPLAVEITHSCWSDLKSMNVCMAPRSNQMWQLTVQSLCLHLSVCRGYLAEWLACMTWDLGTWGLKPAYALLPHKKWTFFSFLDWSYFKKIGQGTGCTKSTTQCCKRL